MDADAPPARLDVVQVTPPPDALHDQPGETVPPNVVEIGRKSVTVIDCAVLGP
jgi:hypothetical protein